jgi:hypothetical protein
MPSVALDVSMTLFAPGLPPPFGYGRTADAASAVRSYHPRTLPTLVGPVTGGDT